MKKQIHQVYAFHKAFGHPVQMFPRIPDAKRVLLRQQLINEEAQEFVDASDAGNIVEVADALIDLLYVIYGAALEFGLADLMESMFDEVHRSNMSKLGDDGKPITRADGKTLKGPRYSEPDLKSILLQP